MYQTNSWYLPILFNFEVEFYVLSTNSMLYLIESVNKINAYKLIIVFLYNLCIVNENKWLCKIRLTRFVF
jgi:hypothetical protein